MKHSTEQKGIEETELSSDKHNYTTHTYYNFSKLKKWKNYDRKTYSP